MTPASVSYRSPSGCDRDRIKPPASGVEPEKPARQVRPRDRDGICAFQSFDFAMPARLALPVSEVSIGLPD